MDSSSERATQRGRHQKEEVSGRRKTERSLEASTLGESLLVFPPLADQVTASYVFSMAWKESRGRDGRIKYVGDDAAGSKLQNESLHLLHQSSSWVVVAA